MSFTQKFYVADSHFGHASIINTCARPFASVEEMDREMVARWNSVVRPGDIVYHLGDFGWAADDAALAKLFAKLNGRKFLVLGNHDINKSTGGCRDDLAALPWEAAPTHRIDTRDCGHRLILDHYAGRTWSASCHGSFLFYGHSHGRMPPLGRSRDVGVDCPDVQFTPQTFRQLTDGMLEAEAVA
jgi:calcineurin-like phosphoesterase family protein